MDVAVHIGSLLAVVLYFRSDLYSLYQGGIDLLKKRDTQDRRLSLYIIYATLPILFSGYLLHLYMPDGIRSLEIIAWATLLFGILLGYADKIPHKKELHSLTAKDSFIIGLSQMLALIPGTSRSGITMTAGRFLGLSRIDATRFSFLLSIPTIIAAGTLSALDLYESGNATLTLDVFIAIGISFVAALASIHYLLKWLQTSSFKPFVVYRVLLGLFLLGWIYL